ncbi:Choline transporter-like protein 1 [Pseudolycoriella hygida]|uniref:Choline transporter-like protein n=1 Tax=Pseudolycoriella hygida TaxID=35572 RepID=A0A9Q0N338_9DIPT|nr:Choline transporter-like protein 1 [Pseudolycoriella hygida]
MALNLSGIELTDNSGERKPTDVPALYFCIVFILLIFGGFVGYAVYNGSIDRLINGIDDCGNICGKVNSGNDLNFCGPNDKHEFPYTLVNITKSPLQPNVTITHSMCVRTCSDYPGYIEIANRCFKAANASNSTPNTIDSSELIHKISVDLLHSQLTVLVSCFVAVIFSYALLVLFRYAIKYVIWVIYIGLIVVLVAGAIAFIVLYFNAKKQNLESPVGLLIAAGIFAIFAIILGVVIFLFRKRIRLTIQLFKEASKALGDVPHIMIEPLVTFVPFSWATIAFLYLLIVIQTSGNLEVKNDANGNFFKAEYVPDFGCIAAYYINIVAYIWFTQFIFGCQDFVIAGIVCQWFFARTKKKLDSPVSRSFHYLLRIHIGSVCLGSIFITIVKIIRMLVDSVTDSLKNSENLFAKAIACCCQFIVDMLEQLLRYLVRNAYIIVALDGTPLIESGKKAFRLLKENLVDVIALNNVGDFVLFLGRVFVTLIAGFVSYEVASRNEHISLKFIPVILSCILAFLIIHSFLTVYEMTLDTIFICFCVDCEQNDGTTRPYFMSRKMMEVMIELKGEAGGEFTNFGAFKHADAATQPMIQYGQ